MSRHPRPAILVSGGAGYVGAHACKALAAAGFNPVTYDNLGLGHADAVLWGPLEVGDLADRTRLDQVIAHHRPAAVMHFAAFSSVAESVADPGLYYRNNVGGTLTLLEAMRDHGVGALVFSSTAAVYGTPGIVPIDEETPLAPINPYGRSKAAVEAMIADFAAAHGLRYALLRYFNAAGADPDGEIGERHRPETHLIPLALAAITDGGAPLTLFGDDYDTADGTCVRDYIHVSDLADAHVLALGRLLDGTAAMTLNLGLGHGYSVAELLAAIERLTGHPVPHRIGPRRPGDPPRLVARADRARATLGWQPRHDLDSILESAWRWHRRKRRV